MRPAGCINIYVLFYTRKLLSINTATEAGYKDCNLKIRVYADQSEQLVCYVWHSSEVHESGFRGAGQQWKSYGIITKDYLLAKSIEKLSDGKFKY